MADGLTSWMDAVALANTGSGLFWYVKGAYMCFELLIFKLATVRFGVWVRAQAKPEPLMEVQVQPVPEPGPSM